MSHNTAERLSGVSKKIDFHKVTFSKEELQTVLECLVEDLMDTGSIVEKFEKDFKSTFAAKYVISANSLFSAYHLALLALGVGENDSVVLSSFAPLPAFDAILLLKAKPVVIDLGKSSFHPDPEKLKTAVDENHPRAVILDHTYGCLVDFKKYDLSNVNTIEDYSESIGASYDDIPTGKQGTISLCGLSASNVITTGNGAMITTASDTIAETIKAYKYSASLRKKTKIRFDYNLLDFQAAMGIEQISKLGMIIERKKKIAQVYLQAVLSASHETYFQRAGEDQFNRFPVVISKPFDEVQRYFKSLLIGTERTIQEPIHRILELQGSDYPNAERLYQRGHCIPIYPNLTRDNINRIASSLKSIY